MAQNNSTSMKNWPKYLLQWGVLIALILIIVRLLPFGREIDPETLFPLGGLESVAIWLAGGNLPAAANILQITLGLTVAASAMLLGKLFCGYLCPLGTLQQLLAKIRNGLHIRQINIRNGSIADMILRIFKYGLLFWIFYSSIIAGQQAYNRIDPYYAAITGFGSSPVLWMSIVSLSLFVLGGIIVDSFWCRYICPLGAIANTLKFWIWILGVTAVYFVLVITGVNVQWWMLLGALCLAGYLLEIIHRRPTEQLIYIVKDGKMCNHCGLCTATCPYHIDIEAIDDGKVNCVDCTLCGECTAVCKRDLLNVGFSAGGGYRWLNIFPAMLTVAVAIFGFWASSRIEFPTVNEKWGVARNRNLDFQTVFLGKSHLEKTEIAGLWELDGIESSRIFKEKAEKISGVYGVKTFAGSHRAVLTYDPKKIAAGEIYRQLYTPASIKLAWPDPKTADSVKVITAGIEGMSDYAAAGRLAEKLKTLGQDIYCMETEFGQPVVMRLFVNSSAYIDPAWLNLTASELGYNLTGVESEAVSFGIKDYIEQIFTRCSAESEAAAASYVGWKQYIYEIEDMRCDNPQMQEIVPALWKRISVTRGFIGVYVVLNDNSRPALHVRYGWPLNAEKVHEILSAEAAVLKETFDDADVLEIPGTETRFH